MLKTRRGEPLEQSVAAPGWALDYLVGPTPLAGSNGLRIGPDGALYVAQASAGRIARVDAESGMVAVLPTSGASLVGPDDLAFDSHGNLFITEVMNSRVTMRRPDGSLRVIASDTPAANGITVHADRIFMSEFNPEGRILELFADGSTPRTVASGLMMPNALQLGPDGLLYFPQVVPGEVWRVSPEGGAPERVTGGLAMPTAVKFDPLGRLWAVEAPTGALIRIDVASGNHVEARRVSPGVDNLVFGADGEMLVSHFTDGEIVAVAQSGAVRAVVAPGLLGPFGLAALPDGRIVIADGGSVAAIDARGRINRLSIMVEPEAPGYSRGIAPGPEGSYLISNTAGQIVRFARGQPRAILAEGLDLAMGLTADGAGGAYVCEAGAGRVLSISADGTVRTVISGLNSPADVHRLADGGLIVSEAGAGRLRHVTINGDTTVLLDGLDTPHGVTSSPAGLFVVDYTARRVYLLPADRSDPRIVVSGLPLGAFDGAGIGSLPGIGGILPGPILPFAGLSALPDGRIAVGADAVGGVMLLGAVPWAPKFDARG